MWRLWLPGTEFPRIPWCECLSHVPGVADYGGLGLVLIGSGGLILGSRSERATSCWSLVTLAGLLPLIALDQHRLQPWVHEFVLLLAILSLVPRGAVIGLCRVLVMSIYLWSGISKLDPAFPAAHGEWILNGLVRGLGLTTAFWPEAVKQSVPWGFPVGELLVGLLLLMARTRRWGLFLSFVLHGLLLIALGPLGLDHEAGVLLWNLFFILQNLTLFSGRVDGLAEENSPDKGKGRHLDQGNAGRDAEVPTARGFSLRLLCARSITAAAVLFPATESIGLADHWPSWSVYSSRPAIVTVYVEEQALGRLPASLQELAAPAEPFERKRRVNLDAWSYAVLNCPPYPQVRWRLAVALAVAENGTLGPSIEVHVSRRAGWISTERKEELIVGQQALEQACANFWLNTKQRRTD